VLRLTVGIGIAALAALFALSALRASLYPVGPLVNTAPRRTALMRQREADAARRGRTFRVDQQWIPYAGISPALRRAVLIAEDDAFYSHGGLDWNEIGAAARKNLEKRRVVRGGSTITQQLAKNLFLGEHRTLTRKLTEMFVAFRLERALPKRRIFELYLNLIEWGDGVFGAEAAARHYFGVPASRLSERQAVLLAAIIINPRRYSPLSPTPRIERRVRMIAGRMRRRGYLSAEQYAAVTGARPSESSFMQWFFGAPRETTVAASPGDDVGAAPESMGAPSHSDSDTLTPSR
jgi:monofunctional biosynthetic peptidoglycan transglycosylase